MLQCNRDLTLCLAVVCLTLGLSLVDNATPYLIVVRLPLGLISTMFVPGYLLLAILPWRRELDGKLSITVAIGLSLVVLPFLGLALSGLGWGFSSLALALSLLLFTAPLAALAAWERRGGGGVNAGSGVSYRSLGVGGRLAVLGLLLLVAGGALISYAASRTPPAPYTQFYVLNSNSLAQDYPRSASTAQTLTVGVVNNEGVAAHYLIDISAPGAASAPIVVGDLAAGQTWEQQLTLPALQGGGEQQVQMLLYKDKSDTPYRQLRLILGRTAGWEEGSR
jgi:uncharacterized membrane protein